MDLRSGGQDRLHRAGQPLGWMRIGKAVRGTVFPTTGVCESFNSKLRDALLNGELFYSLAEARIVIESWRQHYNTQRPPSSLGYKPPAPATLLWPSPGHFNRGRQTHHPLELKRAT